jgi:Pyruvate/2-oxoacid:ferredoxin oxidoreductase delta subunit
VSVSDAIAAYQELKRRKIDGVRLFRPSPQQEPFFLCRDSEILLRGGNRSGKTLCSSLRFAAIARDVPITFADGTQVDLRLPHQKNRPLLMWCVGYDLRHIGQTLHRVLLRANLYKIIQDKDSGQWRAYDPTIDREREAECKASPPLIPESEIEDITWENKGERQFSTITLKNGTIICAFSSMGEVKAGDPVDEIWVDEAIKYPQHYPEWQARLSDRRGRLLWSSWPKRDNMALRTLTKRAKERKENPKSKDSVSEFILRFSENKFIDKDERDKRIAGWSAEDRMARDLGEYALDSLKMYPSFAPEIHCAYGSSPDGDDPLARVLRDRNGQPPHEWTRGICLDPGTANPGALKFCVPPPEEFGDYLVVYGELYPGRCDADEFAKRLASMSGGESFEWLIGDGHALRQTPLGVGMTIGQIYSDAFRNNGLFCHQTGSSFTYGSDDVIGRIGMVNRLLTIRSNGLPKLRIVIQACPNLCRQLSDYERQEAEGPQGPVILDLPAPRQKIDLAVCLEYIASRSPQYIPRPHSSGSAKSGASRAWAKIQEESARQRGGQPVICGVEAASRGNKA